MLAGREYGRLVPVGDREAMAVAILDTLDEEPDRRKLRRRAAELSVERSGERYLEAPGLCGPLTQAEISGPFLSGPGTTQDR